MLLLNFIHIFICIIILCISPRIKNLESVTEIITNKKTRILKILILFWKQKRSSTDSQNRNNKYNSEMKCFNTRIMLYTNNLYLFLITKFNHSLSESLEIPESAFFVTVLKPLRIQQIVQI